MFTKKNIYILLVILIIITPFSVYATNDEQILQTKPSQNELYNYKDYVIDNYDVNIKVNENNTFDIIETITAYFNIDKHGIIRDIPIINSIERTDGIKSTNKAIISNLNVNNEYTTSSSNGIYSIKIGSPDKTITGEQIYIINYNYNIGNDPIEDYDEFYYNIIGDKWDTVIGNITFTINMPKEFDNSKLNFYHGINGSTNSDNMTYTINNNIITGSYNGVLKSNEALTMRLILDEGYFDDATSTTSPFIPLMFIIPGLFTLISFILWYKFGKDKKIIETVEFYPPKEFNSLELKYLYKGKIRRKNITSLLIYLANKGYIKISETDIKLPFNKQNEFKITKLKEYDGNNINEKLFLEGLFKKNYHYINTKKILKNLNYLNEKYQTNETYSYNLDENFYKSIKKILSNINNKKNKQMIFKKTFCPKLITILMLIISIFITVLIPYLDYAAKLEDALWTILSVTIIFTILYKIITSETNILSKIIFAGTISYFFFKFFKNALLITIILNNPLYFNAILFDLFCIISITLFFKFMPKRNKFGNEILGKIKGFKNFLETAEKENLENLVTQNPTYFYDILPYTYVLNVSDKWIKNFESITLQSPDWYDSPNTFNIKSFESFINSTLALTEHSSSSSSSSSSGGGSSGGGSGGGGGSSW